MGGEAGGADHADADDECRLGDGGGGWLSAARSRRGPRGGRRPSFWSIALFRQSTTSLGGLCREVWPLEQCLEAVLAAEPAGRLRGDAGDFGRDGRDRPPRSRSARSNDRPRACLGGRRKRMARPVSKRFPRPGPSSLHRHTPVSGSNPDQVESTRPEPHKGAGIECQFSAHRWRGTAVDCQAISLPPPDLTARDIGGGWCVQPICSGCPPPARRWRRRPRCAGRAPGECGPACCQRRRRPCSRGLARQDPQPGSQRRRRARQRRRRFPRSSDDELAQILLPPFGHAEQLRLAGP